MTYREWLLFYGYKDTTANQTFWKKQQTKQEQRQKKQLVELQFQASLINIALSYNDDDAAINAMIRDFLDKYRDLIINIRHNKSQQNLRFQLEYQFKFIPKHLSY